MSGKVFKKIEIVGTSDVSFSDATEVAVKKAAESLHNLAWFEVVEHRGAIHDGAIREYQVTIRVGFRLD